MAGIALTKLFKEFFQSERASGFVLIGCTVLSLLVTNSGAGAAYLHFWHTRLNLSFGSVLLDYPLEYWVNDGLMAIFFLLVGLEIKRELYIGELADFRRAMLPLLAAVGGMLAPAGIHFLFNHGTATQSGIGIPMATDIAFALGILSLLGNKIPGSVKIFLTALAIIDDLGAVLVIAVFYTKTISLIYLSLVLGIVVFLLVLNRLKVNKLVFYLLPGIFLWWCLLRSGIHATIAGVLLAFVIPFRKAIPENPLEKGKHLPGPLVNPSAKLQHLLHKPVAFIILPVFALANTGILLSSGWPAMLLSRNSLGILAGLVVGKPLGIGLFCLLATRSGFCRLPGDMGWKQLIGIGILAGIGFTMSIFITNLAFDSESIIRHSKIAILVSSLLASILGYLFLSQTAQKSTPNEKKS
jgi:NhaA family Na+:H+ antiporter